MNGGAERQTDVQREVECAERKIIEVLKKRGLSAATFMRLPRSQVVAIIQGK